MKKYFAHSFFRNPGQENYFKISRYSIYAGICFSVFIIAFGLSVLFFWARESLGLRLSVFILILDIILFMVVAKNHEKFIQGLQGEKMVFYELLELVKDGYDLYSSVPCDKFDMDFILVSAKGVFIIEVKNPLKKSKDDKIIFSENKLRILYNDGKSSVLNNRDPIKQVKNNAECFSFYLKNLIGKSIDVKSVILFPGFLVEEYIKNDLIVLNPKRFVVFVKSLPDSLSKSEINEINVAIKSRLKHIHDEIWKE